MDEGTVLVTVSGSRHKIKREEESNMLIIDGNSVYEIDEYAARDQNTKRP